MTENDLYTILSEKRPGFLTLGNARMALVDIQAGFWSIRRQLQSLIGSRLTDSVLQQAGTNAGASFAKSFIADEENDHAAAFSACLHSYQAAGFGHFEITSMELPLGCICILATETFEAWMMQQNHQNANTPVCAYSAGVLVGFINVISKVFFTV